MNRKFILPVMILAIVSTTLFGIAHTYAGSTPAERAKYPAVVQKIADKFGLKVTDVQAVFDQDKVDRQTEMQTKFEDQLTKDVTDGKLTEAQKQAIIAKRAELLTNIQSGVLKGQPENFKNMTEAERKTALEQRNTQMETQKASLETWAKENGIDLKYLYGLGMGGFGFGGRGEHGFGGPGRNMPTSEQQPSQ